MYDIIIDSREQLPLSFDCNTVCKYLKVGDYACEYKGVLLKTHFERKSPSDFFGTLVQGHNRFIRELERAKALNIKLIVIVECDYSTFVKKEFDGAEHSFLSPLILTKILHTTMLNHNLEVVFCNGRKEMVLYIKNYFDALKNKEIKRLKEEGVKPSSL